MSRLRVLLVEDSPADAELVQALLEESLPSADLVGTPSLSDAVEQLAAQPWDLVVADLSLPDAGGLDVVRRLCEVRGEAALVVLTGRADRELALAALTEGAEEYLVKGQDDGSRLATALLHAVQRSRVEAERRRYERLAHSLLDALDAPTCAVDPSSRIVAVNAAWRAFATAGGLDPDAAGEGASYLEVCDGVSSDAQDAPVAAEVAAGLRDVLSGRAVRYQRDYPCHSPDEQRWFSVRIAAADVDGGRGAVVTHVDVSQMQQTQEELAHQALHDGLTGLPNRLLLTDRLAQALADCRRRGTQLAVAFIDLDHFKRVNDSLGHPAGDALLVEVGRRLRTNVRVGDTLARFSGDEFVVVWRDLADVTEAIGLSSRLSDALAQPFDLGSATVTVTASVGLTVGGASQTAEELLLAADAAM